MQLNIHSIIDVITNSSTEIFTQANANSIQDAHDMIDEILKISGSDKKSKDLFDIHIEPDDWSYITDRLSDYDLDDLPGTFDRSIIEKFNKDLDDLAGYKERSQYRANYVIPYLKERNRWEDLMIGGEDDRTSTHLCILAKDKNISETDIARMLLQLHSTYEGNC